jgi:hypothetical protein
MAWRLVSRWLLGHWRFVGPARLNRRWLLGHWRFVGPARLNRRWRGIQRRFVGRRRGIQRRRFVELLRALFAAAKDFTQKRHGTPVSDGDRTSADRVEMRGR